jgi:hypothetical protein
MKREARMKSTGRNEDRNLLDQLQRSQQKVGRTIRPRMRQLEYHVAVRTLCQPPQRQRRAQEVAKGEAPDFGEMTAVKAALLNIPPSRLLFGTDYPQEIRDQEQVKAFIEGLKTLAVPSSDIDAILGGNARALLGP